MRGLSKSTIRISLHNFRPTLRRLPYLAKLHVGALGGGGIHGVAIKTGVVPDRVARHALCKEAGRVGRLLELGELRPVARPARRQVVLYVRQR